MSRKAKYPVNPLLVSLMTLAPGQHFKTPDARDGAGWEGILVYATFGSARIKRLGEILPDGGRSNGEFMNIASNSQVLPLDKFAAQYAA